MLKVTTSHGTYYIIDHENSRAKRVRAEGRGHMYDDNEWFDYQHVSAWDDGKEQGNIEVGKAMLFILTGQRYYDWRTTTRVTSIEEYDG